MPPERRITQRAPQSCIFCARRKLRCSKTIPCANCVERDMAGRCQREAVILSSAAGSRRPSHHQDAADQAASSCPTPARTATPPSGEDAGAAGIRTTPASHAMALSVLLETPGWASTVLEQSTAAPEDQDASEPEETTPPDVSDDIPQSHLAVEAALSLESLAWGNHREDAKAVPSPAILALIEELKSVVNTQQAREILRFHTRNVAWMHNVVYMPFFVRECEDYFSGRHHDAAWLSLYVAILCTGVYYMSESEHQQASLEHGFGVAKTLYRITVEAIAASDFMVLQSQHSLQAICVIVLCAHALGDTRRIKVLLACANSIGESVGHRLHQLEATSSCPRSFAEQVDHEVRKRLWCFLQTQDWYLIASKRAYSIVPGHGTTTLPANCREDFDDATDGSGPQCLANLPLSVLTQSTHMLLLAQLTSIYRGLFDRLCAVHACGGSTADGFDAVLAADAHLEAVMGDIEQHQQQNQQQDLRAAAQWRALIITSWHQRVMMHQTFFCRSFQEKRYHYSRFVCLAAARKILRAYLDAPTTAGADNIEIWTIPTHAISGCIVITLNALFTAEQYTLESSDGDLMRRCLAQLAAAPRPNAIVARGVQVVQRLCQPGPQRARFSALDPREIAQLVRDIGRGETSGSTTSASHLVSATTPVLADLPSDRFGDDELFMPWWYDTMRNGQSV